jgi:hypothetical protein
MHTYSVQFRISGKDLDPADVTRKLDIKPNQVRIAGERRSANRVWEESLWSYDGNATSSGTAREWASLEEGLRYVLERLLSKKELIQEYAKSYDVVWWCGHFQSGFDGGPTLSAPLMKFLGDLGIPLFIDNYFREDP